MVDCSKQIITAVLNVIYGRVSCGVRNYVFKKGNIQLQIANRMLSGKAARSVYYMKSKSSSITVDYFHI